jgi:carotenoid cleavage dioxygenase
MWRDSMDDFAPSYLYRWEFDLESGKVSEQQLDDVAHAFPRVDERAVGLRHRYGWAVAPRPGNDRALGGPSLVVKYDLERGNSSVHDFGPNAQPGEFVFAEASDSSGEDEGYALGFVYDEANDSSDLVILDASDMSRRPVARIHMPRRVPHGFHGSWIRD